MENDLWRLYYIFIFLSVSHIWAFLSFAMYKPIKALV